ncbi:hypothetical protein PUN28_013793 [Cardiocondyla obscurior]|uniref:Secreted protein n=1 Tax=Cardiocondyla obscurior TaxID=286306 RepID=A0AAW2F763_9HYME
MLIVVTVYFIHLVTESLVRVCSRAEKRTRFQSSSHKPFGRAISRDAPGLMSRGTCSPFTIWFLDAARGYETELPTRRRQPTVFPMEISIGS